MISFNIESASPSAANKAVKLAGYIATAAIVTPVATEVSNFHELAEIFGPRVEVARHADTSSGLINDGRIIEQMAGNADAEISAFFNSLAASQEKMDEEIAAVLDIDLWDLYVKV